MVVASYDGLLALVVGAVNAFTLLDCWSAPSEMEGDTGGGLSLMYSGTGLPRFSDTGGDTTGMLCSVSSGRGTARSSNAGDGSEMSSDGPGVEAGVGACIVFWVSPVARPVVPFPVFSPSS